VVLSGHGARPRNGHDRGNHDNAKFSKAGRRVRLQSAGSRVRHFISERTFHGTSTLGVSAAGLLRQCSFSLLGQPRSRRCREVGTARWFAAGAVNPTKKMASPRTYVESEKTRLCAGQSSPWQAARHEKPQATWKHVGCTMLHPTRVRAGRVGRFFSSRIYNQLCGQHIGDHFNLARGPHIIRRLEVYDNANPPIEDYAAVPCSCRSQLGACMQWSVFSHPVLICNLSLDRSQ